MPCEAEILKSDDGGKLSCDETRQASEPEGQDVVSVSAPTSFPPIGSGSPYHLFDEPPATLDDGPKERGEATGNNISLRVPRDIAAPSDESLLAANSVS